MKGVDQANQLRAGFTCHRKQNYRTWWPLFFFFLDVAHTNAYLLWKWSNSAQNHDTHRTFMSALCDQLLHSNDPKEEEQSQPLPTIVSQGHHKCVREKTRGRCEWGKLHKPGCVRKRAPKRKFGTNITETAVNGANEAISGGSRTFFKCSKCQIWLCIEGSCWQQYHHSIGVNC